MTGVERPCPCPSARTPVKPEAGVVPGVYRGATVTATDLTAHTSAEHIAPSPAPPPGRVPVDWRRVRRPMTVVCVTLALVGAVSSSLGSVVAGRLADAPTSALVTTLALCVVGGAVVDTAARTIWGVVVDRAEGQLRADLIDAAMAQPLSELSEQAVGEVLDRIDDDTWEVGQLMRWGVWMALRTVLVGRSAVDRRRRDVVARRLPVPALRRRRVVLHPPAAPPDRRAQGARGGRLDRPRRVDRGGHRGARRHPHLARPAARAAPQRRAGRRDPPPAADACSRSR